jgi:tRNA modification GTPase
VTAGPTTHVTLATAHRPGAVAILQLHGPGAADLLGRLTGRRGWDVGRLRLCDFAGIDSGLAVVLGGGCCQVMPHGGPRVVRKLLDWLMAHGAVYDARPDPRVLYPEASSPIEAEVLAAIARAASPAAIDLLAAQPEVWRAYVREGRREGLLESDPRDHLLVPPRVVVVGRANVGKSTLLNALTGREVAIAHDLPGTTRDYVGSLVDLDGITVQWFDTPGLRAGSDPIEQRSIALARRVIAEASVLIAMRDMAGDWVDARSLPREPDLWVVNKVDAPADVPVSNSPATPLPISAVHGHKLDALRRAIVRALGLDDLSPVPPWAFAPTLKRLAAGDELDWRAYVGL